MEEARTDSLHISVSSPVSDELLLLFFKAMNDSSWMKKHLSKELHSAWVNNWEKISIELQKDPAISPIIPPDDIHPFFNCALNYCRLKGHHHLVFGYLKTLALEHSNFHAARAAVNICINQLCSEKENTNININVRGLILTASQISDHAAQRHLTPGYILSALLHFFTGQYFNNKDNTLAIQHYSTCYRQLLMAEALEPYSEQHIESCYNGTGIIASNPWGCNSVDELKSHFSKLIDTRLLSTQKIQSSVDSEVARLIPLLETYPTETAGLTELVFK